ncbi:hypothetical protein [Xylocopilactobacillus apis]|uniref:Uncharacterized protein n=1 Tax=Xylocopilactobacillus apis TaxID=2932183 RepID=A0AAU9DGG3_9LACO|nr:hypothetical protein [Xylocopilactobacillus apis]BDR55812.1 hypothetical protein KIMC2_03740 [Xylocopilactobacillus apis]
MLSLFISIFVIILILGVCFSILGLIFGLLFKFLGIIISVAFVAWIIDLISGGRLFKSTRNRYRNRHYHHRDWYVVDKKNRRRNHDHDEWSNF